MVGRDSSLTYQADSLATRKQNLLSTATAAVEFASLAGKGVSSELDAILRSFLTKHNQAKNTAAGTTGNKEKVILANPVLKKNQTQVRIKPVYGPTTKTAARISQKGKSERKKETKAKQKKRTQGF